MGEAYMWFAISIFRLTSTAAAHTRGLAAEPFDVIVFVLLSSMSFTSNSAAYYVGEVWRGGWLSRYIPSPLLKLTDAWPPL
jgi:hypothetical protein